MKKVLFLLGLVSWCLPGMSQRIVVSNKAYLTAYIELAKPMGAENYANGLSTSPSLMGNMTGGYLFGASYLQQVLGQVYAGMAISKGNFSGWHSNGSHLLDGAKTTIASAGPIFSFRSNSATLYRLKTVLFFASFSPSINNIETTTTESSTINNTQPPIFLTAKSTRFGMEFHGGIEMLINSFSSFTLSVGYRMVKARSLVFPDQEFDFLSFRAGLSLRLLKNKKYKYSDF